jgi:hypothetical protein
MATTPKYGERTAPDNLDVAEIDFRRAQIASVEKNTEMQATKNGLLVVTIFLVLSAAIPLEIFFWHLALK